jgi:hypothetical protein
MRKHSQQSLLRQHPAAVLANGSAGQSALRCLDTALLLGFKSGSAAQPVAARMLVTASTAAAAAATVMTPLTEPAGMLTAVAAAAAAAAAAQHMVCRGSMLSQQLQ